MPEAGATSPDRKSKVFVSYSRRNMAFADRLEEALKAHHFEPLIDRTEIYAFEDWWKRIQALIEEADTVIFALSPDSVSSEVCGKEVAYAASLNKRFAPIVVQKVEDHLVPEPLARLNFIFFDDDSQFDANITRLTDALSTDIGWVRKHTEFAEMARSWDAAKRANGLLLRSPLLEEAERWIATRPADAPAPTEVTQAFIVASRSGATRRRNILTGSLAAGLVVALALAGLAYWQRSIAVEQRQYAEQQRQLAEQQRHYAETALDAGITTSNDLSQTLASRLRNEAGVPSSIVKYMLDSAVTLQEKLASFGRSTPDLKIGEARALMEVSVTRRDIGDNSGAVAAADKARQLFEDVLTVKPGDIDEQSNLAVTLVRLSDALEASGDYQKALDAARKAVDAGNVAANNHAGDADQRDGADQALVAANLRLGDMFERIGKKEDALAAYRASLAIGQKRVDETKGNMSAEAAKAYGSSNERVGRMLLELGKRDEALPAFQRAEQVFQFLSDKKSGDTELLRDLSVAHNNIGNVMLMSDRLDDALTAYRKALAIRQRLANSDKDNLLWQRDTAISAYMIAGVLAKKNDSDGALSAYQSGITTERNLVAKDPNNAGWQRDIAIADLRAGEILRNQGKLDAAQQTLRDGAGLFLQLAKSHPNEPEWTNALPDFAQQFAFVGYRYLFTGEYAKSLDVTNLAITLAPGLIWIQAHRAHALLLLGRGAEAQNIYLSNRSYRNVFGDAKDPISWSGFVLEEFGELHKAGINTPMMTTIERQLATDG